MCIVDAKLVEQQLILGRSVSSLHTQRPLQIQVAMQRALRGSLEAHWTEINNTSIKVIFDVGSQPVWW